MVLAFLAGVASSTQGLYNGYWQEKIGLKVILLVNSLVVFAAVLLFYLVSAEGGLKLPLEKMDLSVLIGGICGFFIIMVFAVAFPAIGATATALFFISGLLIASLVFDHTGALDLAVIPFSFQKLFGIVLVVTGSYIALRSPL
jgi:transporter family-2 protein